MDEFYSVESLAETCGTTPRAIRLYVEKGLLTPPRAGRTYVFTASSAHRVAAIQRIQRLGFSLGEIHDRFARATPRLLESMIERIEALRRDAERELKDLHHDRDGLQNLRREASS
ncbi:MerR family transcriptional regulator [Magnetospira sp. QH-2]|uniref:MerR family transcriptional regulator n=1 Tax=Magnetospira sp. (strain QH-2) TaxID=1288970 RepID=UPI0003E80E65|nr:MerR family transcriptional regulator [Magnetospira sp. QH-2]CCQ73246.1 Putative transcriptional regulator, MerR family [Magnetospira sp. QH-2]